MGDLEAFDRDFIVLRIERRALPLGGPALSKVPFQCGFSRLVQKLNRARLALRLTVNDLSAPVPQPAGVGVPPLQWDVRLLGLTRELAHGDVLISVAVLDDVGFGCEPTTFG